MSLFGETPTAGQLITIDGPNGSGKTSLVAALVAHLRAAGLDVHSTCQPSPSRLGDEIREAEATVGGRALACLVAGDRHHQAATEIAPRLAEGITVICDRYVESSLVLQRLDGVETEYILAINAGIPRPTTRMRLLAEPDLLAARLAERPSDPSRRFERTAGTERELELYAQADELLISRERLPATVIDTSLTHADALGASVAAMILEEK
ncbi:MAG TPA: dTMP kinase [Solirubrobacteraceae bacterium]|jgi:dTMP kinase